MSVKLVYKLVGAPKNSSWVWKQICKEKDVFKHAYHGNHEWQNGVKKYSQGRLQLAKRTAIEGVLAPLGVEQV